MWRNLHKQVNNNEYAPKCQYWQIYFKGSVLMNLPWWIDIDDGTPVGQYWWYTLTIWYPKRYTSKNLHHTIDNDKLIMNNLPQWVNIYESTCLYQYWQMYPNVLIWTNLTQWVNIDQTTLMSQYWQMYLTCQYRWIYPIGLISTNHLISINLRWRININKSTLMSWYLCIYTDKTIMMNLQQWINMNASISMNLTKKLLLMNLHWCVDKDKSTPTVGYWLIFP